MFAIIVVVFSFCYACYSYCESCLFLLLRLLFLFLLGNYCHYLRRFGMNTAKFSKEKRFRNLVMASKM